jgi:TonB family protein
MALVLLKTTLLFAFALACLPLMRRTSSVVRHLICACAMCGALLLPLTMLAPPQAAPIRVSTITFLAASAAARAHSDAATWVSPALLSVWIIGMAALLLRLGFGYWRLAHILRTATPGDGYVLSDVSVPMVAGLLRPVILMPRAAESWPFSQRAAALKHERAHLERRDLWTSLIAHLTCAIYWFHPLAWAVARRLRQEQETACDDAVLCAGFEPASYAEALIATARQITSTNLIGCHMTQKTLKSRIARLFENGMPRMSSPATLRRVAISFVAIAAVIALLNGNPRVRAAQTQTEPPAYRIPMFGHVTLSPFQSAQALPALPMPPAPPLAAPSPDAGKPGPAEAPAAPLAAPVADAGNPGPADNPVKMGPGIVGPSVLSKIDPDYTEDAKAAKINGSVLLSLVVGTDGLAHDINIVSGIDSGLDQNAVAAVQKWHFQPATKDGQPVAVQARIEVNFKLL